MRCYSTPMKLCVSLAQIQVEPSQPDKNVTHAEPWMAVAAKRGADLICFPEMWTTGFAWDDLPRLKESCAWQTRRLSSLARRHGIWIAGSLAAYDAETERWFNALTLINRHGECVAVYHKTHLFGGIYEERHLTPGDRPVTAETPWGRIGLAICYDLRCPELFRTYALQDVNFVLLPAAFPLARRAHWQTLIQARAIENQFFMIGTNRAGAEHIPPDRDVTYAGASCVVDPCGRVLAEAGEQEELITATLDTEVIRTARQEMPALQQRRPDVYRL